MANQLARSQQQTCLHLLLEGNSLRSTARLTGVHRTTIQHLVVRFGTACRDLMDDAFRGLQLEHVEVDEMWTFVRKKQSRLTIREREQCHDIGDVYLWTCLDLRTKLIPSHVVGKRSADNARKLMNDLQGRLDRPAPHQSDDHAFERGTYAAVVQLSTDGFAGYPEAVDLAFGPYVKFGTIIKDYRNATMTYTPSELVGTRRTSRRGEVPLWSICTSHVERHNLTVRTFMKRFARLSLGFSKKLENLQAAVAMFLAYYNFVWRTWYPDGHVRRGQLRPTAAMMAGVTDRLWDVPRLFDEAMMYA